MHIPRWLDPDNVDAPFPDVAGALRDPDGLLAIGGGLEPSRLLRAYRQGIFPWYNPGDPILWWSPDPRMVMFPQDLKISRSLRKTLRKQVFSVTLDSAFEQVIDACALPRNGQEGTWITTAMRAAYLDLHHAGHAHSVEAWQDGKLAGGLYGIAIGRVFFGESMFSFSTDASKVAFVHLVTQLHAWDFTLVDCQVYTRHLASLGASPIPRSRFIQHLQRDCEQTANNSGWRLDPAAIHKLVSP